MKTIFMAIAALACAATSPVMAQGMGSPGDSAPRNPNRTTSPPPVASHNMPGPDRGGPNDMEHGPDHQGMGDRDNHGQSMGGRHASSRHVRACQQRYRSYNPRTDRYVVRRGVTRRCTL